MRAGPARRALTPRGPAPIVDAPPKEATVSTPETPTAPSVRRPTPALAAGLAWCLLIALSAALTGCPRFTAAYAAYLAVSLALVGVALVFARRLWNGAIPCFPAGFKKLCGYGIVALYAAHSIPRVGWQSAGLIADRRAAFIFALTLLCTAAGICFFLLMARDPALPRRDKANASLRRRGPLLWVLDWVDALASAIVAVLLIQIFIFQLYVVPTESMVPVFLGNDRPFTLKLLNGPRLPLTEWRLPVLRAPRRGDVVTIANPRYPENSGVNLKKYLSQMVFMATVTLVNIDKTTADGTLKSDPLVKRIVGVPGEKLMMVDDVLYARTAASPDFAAVEQDAKSYARTDLWSLPDTVRSKVKAIPVSQETRAMLKKWDAVKNGSSPESLSAALRDAAERLSTRAAAMPAAALSAFETEQLPRADAALAALRDAALAYAPSGAANPIARGGAGVDDLSLALALCRSASARRALAEYAAVPGTAGPTLYEKGSRTLNLMVKTNLVRRMARDLELVAARATLEVIQNDAERVGLVQAARELYYYLVRYYDTRNFPEFPAGSASLGPGQYFAMGDNRYNSMDFRFQDPVYERALDASDPASVRYKSQLAPFPLEERFIEGWAVLRVWPFTRLGLIR
jgi:signal peptidase I